MAPPEITARTVGRAAGWAAVGHLVGRASQLVSLVALAALVAPRAFGTVSAAMVVVNLAVLLVGAGTRGSLITSPGLRAEHVRYSLAVNTGLGIVATAAVAALAAPIVSLTLQDGDPAVLRVLIASVGLYALSVVPLALLQRQMQFKQEAAVTASATVVASVVAIASALLGAGVWALVVRQVLWSALVAGMAWVAARHLLPPPRELAGRVSRPPGGRGGRAAWFVTLAVFSLVAMSIDFIIVGRLAGATQLGLYSLAFTLGFAPLTNFSWRLGGVLLPAAAATGDPALLARRTTRAMRVVATVLLPFVVPSLVLAPWLIPAVLGARWTPMVVPFQILLPAGVAHAIVNVAGESLSGSGNIDLHARLHILWAASMVPALIVLVKADGIRGAAIAHAIVLVPIAAGYLILGARRLGMATWGLVRPLAGLLAAVLAQLAVTLTLVRGLEAAGLSHPSAAVAGALGGMLVVAGILGVRGGPMRELGTLVASAAGRV